MHLRSVTPLATLALSLAVVAGLVPLGLGGSARAQGEPTGAETAAPAPLDIGAKVPGVFATQSREAANGQFEREETLTVGIPPAQPLVVYTLTTRNGTISGASLREERYQRAATPSLPGVPPEKIAAGPIDMVSTWSTRQLPFATNFEELGYSAPAIVAVRRGAVDGVIENGMLLAPAAREKLAVDKPVVAGDELIVTAPANAARSYTVKLVSSGGTITPDPAFPPGKATGVAYEIRRKGDLKTLYEADPTYTRVSPEAGLPVIYVWPDPKNDESPVYIERRFDAGKQPYELVLSLTVHNLGDQVLRVNPEIRVAAWQHPQNMAGGGMFGGPTPIMEGTCQTIEGAEHAPFKSLHEKAIDHMQQVPTDGAIEIQRHGIPTTWAGVGTNYFLSAVVPIVQAPGGQCKIALRDFEPASPGHWVLAASWIGSNVQTLQGRPIGTGQVGSGACVPSWLPETSATAKGALRCGAAMATLGLPDTASARDVEQAWGSKRKAGGDLTAVDRAHEALAGRKQATWRFSLYNGPKEEAALAATSPDLEASLRFGWMTFVGRPLHKVLVWFYNGLGSWPLAIILLTIILKGLTWPLNSRSYRSLQKMQALKPKLEELKRKTGDDKQRFQQEQMALYRREGVNPLASCLPMLLQFPIWVGLYGSILGSVELYHEPLGLWVPDLSAPDPIFVMPILLGILMFVQTWLTPSAGGTDGMQAKIMKYGMPLLFTTFMLFLPSGLVLYIIVNTALTIGQNVLIRRRFKPA
ncbi:MAG: YidC/Oxa1 family insertase periplasmic-domain containing protein [Myxococcota bacterium]